MNKKLIESYHPNGVLRIRTELGADGRPEGTFEEFFPSGALRLHRGYVRGFMHGKCVQYNESGEVLGGFEMSYGTGVYKEWYDTGALRVFSHWKAGEQHGLDEYYDNTGRLSVRTYYLEGKKVSKKVFDKVAAENDPK
jgi:uncharacterized protein